MAQMRSLIFKNGALYDGIVSSSACFAISMATNSTRELLPRRPKRYAPLRTEKSIKERLFRLQGSWD